MHFDHVSPVPVTTGDGGNLVRTVANASRGGGGVSGNLVRTVANVSGGGGGVSTPSGTRLRLVSPERREAEIAKKRKLGTPDFDVVYRVRMPVGNTERTRRLLKTQSPASPTTVFSRLGTPGGVQKTVTFMPGTKKEGTVELQSFNLSIDLSIY